MEKVRYFLPRSILYVDHGKYAVIESEEAISYILDNSIKIFTNEYIELRELIPQSIEELQEQQTKELWFFDTSIFDGINEHVYIEGDREKIIMFKMMFHE